MSELLFTEKESKYRGEIENFLTPEECQKIQQIIDDFAIEGDGYDNNPHPHSKRELFKAVNTSKIPNESIKLFLSSLESKILKTTQEYFKDQKINIYLSHLVCRKTLSNSPMLPNLPMSHPLHYDVNYKDKFNRSHSIIIFLNENFDGGYFMFEKFEEVPKRFIRPKTGKLIMFSCKENLHGVTHLYSGSRYVWAIWMTTDNFISS